MLRLIKGPDCDAHRALLHGMFADRKRLFVDMMGWKLKVEDGEERDDWDDGDAEYLILEGPEPGQHLASLRLLRTERPHLLDTIFPQLCERLIPRGLHVREITRLCLPVRRRARDRIEARNVLARAISDYALVSGISSYTAVCNMGFLTELLTAGWRCDPLGLPKLVDGALAGALEIHMGPEAANVLAAHWRCNPVTPRMIEFVNSGGVPLAA